jgi:predicted DNA-binding transcriptional regulator AlpA
MPAEPITDQQVKLLTVPELAHLLSVPASWVYAKVEAASCPTRSTADTSASIRR